MNQIIKVENIGKKYTIGHNRQESYQTLRDSLSHHTKSIFQRFRHPLSQNREKVHTEEFWALKDISFEVFQGDRIGIIGRNGAGKSTLLKIISRITHPTTGKIYIKGRVASLLEVGTGFHPELSGRENIFLNGAILGMSRHDIKKRFDQIVDFAEIEKFIDTPVKRYSSGMYVRLAFAVAAHIEPDVLIVDEVLAVGDAEFQKKCMGKMEGIGEEGRTVIFVSHNMDMIKRLCNRGIILKNGSILDKGSTEKIIDRYLSTDDKEQVAEYSIAEPKTYLEAYISKICFENIDGSPQASFPIGRPWQIRVTINVNEEIKTLFVSCGMRNKTGGIIRTTWGTPKSYLPGKYEIIMREEFIRFTPGRYPLYFGLDRGKGQRIQLVDNIVELEINDIPENIHNRTLDINWGIFQNRMTIID